MSLGEEERGKKKIQQYSLVVEEPEREGREKGFGAVRAVVLDRSIVGVI